MIIHNHYQEFHVPGRGKIIGVDRRVHPGVDILQVGQFIFVAGQRYEVRGLEKSFHLTCPVKPGNYVGILVRLES